eukprot:TRINITY_DN4359_c0_g1_i1.p1 TRINITY_DN4359_c0_g1~~TRINITY_DN4359_c0_g1_i1.p1  ORF type:complete len:339 (+),score=177.15 TRINITY_DN4359_c0_g1_i1:44-1018(+)
MSEFNSEPFDKYYEKGKILGSGSFSDVFLCTEKSTGKEWAVKIVAKESSNKSEKRMEIIMAEIDILKVVDHRNVVSMKEVFETPTHFYIVIEIISGGELFDKIVELTHYSEKDASKLIYQVLSGIDHLHTKNIVHRDLKPENLLLASKDLGADVKITDFGLSKIFKQGDKLEMTNAVGTPGYIAPEVLFMLDDGVPYGKEVDLWGIGVILYILLCGFPPFYGDTDDDIYDKIVDCDWKFLSPFWDHVSDSAKDLITKLLTLDREKRFTTKQAMEHPWIAQYEQNSDANMEEAITQLKKFNARRKFKGAIHAVKAITKMRTAFSK